MGFSTFEKHCLVHNNRVLKAFCFIPVLMNFSPFDVHLEFNHDKTYTMVRLWKRKRCWKSTIQSIIHCLPCATHLAGGSKCSSESKTRVTLWVSWAHAGSCCSSSWNAAYSRGSGTARPWERFTAVSTQPMVPACRCNTAGPSLAHPPLRPPPASGSNLGRVHPSPPATHQHPPMSTSPTSLLPLAWEGGCLRNPWSTRWAQGSALAQTPASSQAAVAPGSGRFTGACCCLGSGSQHEGLWASWFSFRDTFLVHLTGEEISKSKRQKNP